MPFAGQKRPYVIKEVTMLITPVSHCLEHDRTSTSRLASDGHFARIAAEFLDIILDPAKSKTLIQEAGVDLAMLFDVFR